MITDLTMPDLTGDKLAAELTAIRPGLPILLCSGFSEEMSLQKAASIGIKGFLRKPVVLGDLANTIRKALDQEECDP